MTKDDDLSGYPEVVWAEDTPSRRLRRMQDQLAIWTSAVWLQAQRVPDAGDPHRAGAESLLGLMAAQTLLTLGEQIVNVAEALGIDVASASRRRRAIERHYPALQHFRDVFTHPEDYQFGSGRYQARDRLPSGLWFEGHGRDVRASLAGTHRDHPIHSLCVVPLLEATASLGAQMQTLADPNDSGGPLPVGWFNFPGGGD